MKKNSLTAILLCLSVALLVPACESDSEKKTVCGVSDPAENLLWLKLAIKSYQDSGTDIIVQQAEYRGGTVILVSPCCPNCDYIIEYYNCEGESIAIDTGFDNLTNKKTIWVTPGAPCV